MGLTIAVSVIGNPIRDYVPSLIRYLIYIGVFNLFYTIHLNRDWNHTGRIVRAFIYTGIFISLFFGFLEIATGQVEYLNEDYRVAGPFKFHQLAYAMFLFCIMISTDFIIIRKSRSVLRKIFFGILWMLMFYLFVRTGSRAMFVILFITYFVVFFFAFKSLKKRFLLITAFCIIALAGAFAILQLNISPRLKTLFVSKDVGTDSSTASRIAIHMNAFEAFKKESKVYGIGMGAFTRFYKNATGADDIAAHNNYLLFLIEGGVIGLILFLGHQIYMFKWLKKSIHSEFDSQNIVKVAFALFVGIDVLGFLQNNYYFTESEAIIWCFYGLAFAEIRKHKRVQSTSNS
ncbi:O-antigen ligase family protein [Ekhidna sp.]|uniref:O-antigen ligase family protein n=1 Tax=Ekhidna sp. TaxID=2608089 RepID=UPI0035192D7D